MMSRPFDYCDCSSFPLIGTIRYTRSSRIKAFANGLNQNSITSGGDCRQRGGQKSNLHCVAPYDLPPTLITDIALVMRDLSVVTHIRDQDVSLGQDYFVSDHAVR